jgi:hypothetical protein
MDYQCTSQIEYFQNSTDLTMEMDPMIYQPTSLEPGNWGIQHSNIKVLQHTVDAILRGNYMSLLVQQDVGETNILTHYIKIIQIDYSLSSAYSIPIKQINNQMILLTYYQK